MIKFVFPIGHDSLIRPALACATISVFVVSGSPSGALAQERTVAPPNRASIVARTLADKVSGTVTDFDNEIETPCGTHAVGEKWTEACTGGLVGQSTKVCVSGGIEALKASNCVAAPKDCGGHGHGATWQEGCGNSLVSGTITYQCNDGNISVASMNCAATYQCLDGSSYTGACPDGMDGTVTYSCNSNTLTAASNTCAVINNPCGGHPHGSTWSTACPAGTTGSITNQCFNGTTGVVAISCVAQKSNCGGHAHGESWQTACDDGAYTSQCFDGEIGITAINCRTAGGEVKNIAGSTVNFWGANIAAAIKAGPTCSVPGPFRTGSIASINDDNAYSAYVTCRLFSGGSSCTSNGMKSVGGYTAQQKSEFVAYFSTLEWTDYFHVQSTSGCHLGATLFAWHADYAKTICKAAGYGSAKSHTFGQYASPGNNSLIWALGLDNFKSVGADTYNYYFTSLVCIKTTPLELKVGQ